MKRALALFAALALAACATLPPVVSGQPAGLDSDVRLGGLIIRPLRVEEDSRCPVKVQCVWQGRFRLRALINEVQATDRRTHPIAPTTVIAREIEFELGKEVTEFGRKLTLTSVTPVPIAEMMTNNRDYRFTFEVRR